MSCFHQCRGWVTGWHPAPIIYKDSLLGDAAPHSNFRKESWLNNNYANVSWLASILHCT